jgi:hypothetical protein
MDMNSLITIDTDNAVIRFHYARLALDIGRDVPLRLVEDLRAIATALSHVTGADFRVEVL